MTGYLICLDEKSETAFKVEAKNIDLTTLQRAVGGYIELAPDPNHALDGYRLVVNEEGRLLGMRENAVASYIIGYPVVGPAVICKESFDDGERQLLAFNEDEANALMKEWACSWEY